MTRLAKFGVVAASSSPLGIYFAGDTKSCSGCAWTKLKAEPNVVLGASYDRQLLTSMEQPDGHGGVYIVEDYLERFSVSFANFIGSRTSIGFSPNIYRTYHTPNGIYDATTVSLSISATHVIPHDYDNVDFDLVLGVGLVNATFPKFRFDSGFEDELPVILRGGPGIVLRFPRPAALTSFDWIEELMQLGLYTEFQGVLNAKERTAARIGAEITTLELMTFRAGYYIETLSGFGTSYDHATEVTWGIALHLPFGLLGNRWRVDFEHLRMNQESLSENSNHYLEPFSQMAVTISYRPHG